MINKFLAFMYSINTELVDRITNKIGGASVMSGVGAVTVAEDTTISLAELIAGIMGFNLSIPHTLFCVSLLGGILFAIEKIIVIKIRLLQKKKLKAQKEKDVEK